jgi:glycerol uptake facilitator-like aquaporin
LIIAASYIAARTMCASNHLTATGSCLNPAIALGTSLVMLFNDGGSGFKWVWLYTLVPFAGAILGVVFHEFVFKRSS